MSHEPIGCPYCGGNDHNADECKRFAGEREAVIQALEEAYADDSALDFLRKAADMLIAAQPAPVTGTSTITDLLEPYAAKTARLVLERPAPVVPGRYALVPVEPTEAMIEAAQPAPSGAPDVADALRLADWSGVSIGNKALIARTVELLSAAPAPAQGQQVECQECERLRFSLEVAKTDELDAAVYAATESLKHELWDAQAELAALKAQQAEQQADQCEECERVFIGLSGETKWCPYCGAKHQGTTVQLAPQPAPAQDVEDWGIFPGYLIDKCEGQVVAEENLQWWLAEMLADPHYGALFRREKQLAEQPSALELSIEAAEEEHGSLRGAAKALGIDPGYLSRLKNGEKTNPSDEVLAALGLERVVMYRAAAHDKQSGGEV